MQHNIHSLIACRTGVIFCVFQGNRGESEAYAKRELRAWEPPLERNSRFALASHLPRLRPCSPEIRKKSRLFCRLFTNHRNTCNAVFSNCHGWGGVWTGPQRSTKILSLVTTQLLSCCPLPYTQTLCTDVLTEYKTGKVTNYVCYQKSQYSIPKE